jgi:hypothetical protein
MAHPAGDEWWREISNVRKITRKVPVGLLWIWSKPQSIAPPKKIEKSDIDFSLLRIVL